MNHIAPLAKLAAKQAAHVTKAQAAGRTLGAFTVRITTDTEGGHEFLVIYATDERQALKVCSSSGLDARTAKPAHVRDLQAALAAVLAKDPAAVAAATEASRAADAAKQAALSAFDREFAALLAEETRETAARAARMFWLTGEGERPTLPEAAPYWPGVGAPRVEITVRPRPGFGPDGNPVIGQGSRSRPGQRTTLAHEYRDVPYTPVFNPAATVGL